MRLYRLLLRAYPAPFRRLYGEALEADFADLLDRTRSRGGRRAVARLWVRTAVDVVRTGIGERLSRRGYRVGRSRLRVPREGLSVWIADAGADLRQGLRSLGRSPGYAAAVLVTLALGIGANTALFSVAYGTLLRPLPFQEGERLVRLVQERPSPGEPEGDPERTGFSVADLAAYSRGVTGLAETSEYHAMTFTLIDDVGPHRVRAGVVSANYFEFLGLHALHGRVLRPDEDHMGADPVIVLTHRYWTERFGGDPGVVGRRVRMNDQVHEIVGVLPAGPQFPFERDVFLPVSACPTRSDPAFIADATRRMMFAYGRMAPGVEVERVAAGADDVLARLAAARPAEYPVAEGFDVRVVPLRADMAAEVGPLAVALLALAGLVLLIACANAAGLALARTGRRLRELEIRGALGAGRGRLVRTLLAESVLLAVVGGLLGLGIAVAGHDLLVGFAARFTTRAQEIRLDGAVLGFAALTSVTVGLVFGAVPGAWIGSRVRRSALETVAATVGSRGRRLQRGLVVAQVAVAFAVVSAAGLALRTVWAVATTELGYATSSVVVAEVAVDKARWQSADSARALFDRVAAELGRHPAVGRVARAMGGPLTGHSHRDAFYVGEAGSDSVPAVARARVVDPGTFEILGIPALEGRTFRSSDGPDAPPVAVVNRAFQRLHPGGAARVGSTLIRCHGPEACHPPARVVGVVDDVRYDGPDEAVGPEVYLVARQQPDYGGEHLLVELRGEPEALEADVVAAVHRVDADLAVSDYTSLAGLRRDRTQPRRFLAGLLGALAAVAGGLAVTGLAGVASLAASARARELGVRRALGATPGGVWRRVVGEGVGVALSGVVIGWGVSWVLSLGFTRFFDTVLWGVTPHDPLTLGVTAVLFVAVAGLAASAPARRAAAVDPMLVLKQP